MSRLIVKFYVAFFATNTISKIMMVPNSVFRVAHIIVVIKHFCNMIITAVRHHVLEVVLF